MHEELKYSIGGCVPALSAYPNEVERIEDIVEWNRYKRRNIKLKYKLILIAMSKISTELIKKSIAEILDPKVRKERKFVETVELQIVLRDYDLEKDKKFKGSVKLPNEIYPRLKVS